MRSLVVAQDFPWPTSLGTHLRLEAVLRALHELGEVDLFALVPARRSEACVLAPEFSSVRLLTFTRPRPNFGVARRIGWLVRKDPIEVSQERVPGAGPALRKWAREYDFVWVSKGSTFDALGRPRLGPTVVDIDDLEDWKIRSRLESERERRDGAPVSARARDLGARVQARLNARRWRRFQRSVASEVDRVAVCSELDASRYGVDNVVVVPNGYDPPEHPPGRGEVGDPPTLLFAGNFCYAPNSDGATWLTSEVLPHLSKALPNVSVRLVGEPDTSVERLSATQGVSVAGRVPRMAPELARADAVAVPVRFGSGTRIKIIEAFANRLPVVSTTVGAEGLDVQAAKHLLIADAPEDFARSCFRVLTDAELRKTLTDNAQSLFLERYDWERARERVRSLALELARKPGP